VLIGAGLATYGLLSGRRQAAGPPSPEPAASWAPGHTRHYAVELISTVKVDAPVFAATVTGAWHLTRLGDGGSASKRGHSSEIRLHAVLEPERVELQTASEASGALATALSREAVLVVDRNGALVSVKVEQPDPPGPVAELARGLLGSLAAVTQIVRPVDRAASQWTAQERDLVGTYEASYDSCGATCLEKTKTRYLSLNVPARLKARTVIDRSETTYRFKAAPSLAALVSVTGVEATHAESEGPLPRLRSETTIKLRLTGVGSRSMRHSAILARSGSWPDALRPELDAAEATDSRHPPRVAFEVALDRIKAAKRAEKGLAQEGRAYAEFVRQLRGSDEDVDKALARILKGEDRGLLIDALGNAGSPRAQAALRTALSKGDLSSLDRHGVALALSLARHPDDKTVAMLDELTADPELRQQALYGLGTSARRLRETDSDSAQDIVEDLIGRLGNAESSGERKMLIRALGNSGSPLSLETLAQLIRDPDPSVRAAAFDAMRFVPGASADAYLAKAMTADESAEVRKACFIAASYREPSPSLVYAVREAVLNDPSAEPREQAVRTALRWTRRAAPLQAALAEVAQNDESKRIRKIASAALR
jgi:HEAT repeat protein